MRPRFWGPWRKNSALRTLARIIYMLVTKRLEYDESHFAKMEQQNQEKLRIRLVNQARALGYNLVPATTAATSGS
jgi:hypothetical protein